jgi:hypothetical protein
MSSTISILLEQVAAALPPGYRVQARATATGHVVQVEDRSGLQQKEFVVQRRELSTDARAEWVAITIARAIRDVHAR